jgi:hypothetical protein
MVSTEQSDSNTWPFGVETGLGCLSMAATSTASLGSEIEKGSVFRSDRRFESGALVDLNLE